MKHALHAILGRRIVAAILGNGYGRLRPHAQLRLVFEDGTSYEFYSSDGHIGNVGGLDRDDIAGLEKQVLATCNRVQSVVLDPDGSGRVVERCEYGDGSEGINLYRAGG